MNTMTRRKLLVFGICACTGAPGVVACGSGREGEEPDSRDERVALSSIPAGGAYTPEATGCSARPGSFIVARDDAGVYAYTNTCTHSGGAVPLPDEAGISRCCLHGSEYDRNGDLVDGVVPGQKNLRHLVVRIEGAGNATVVVVSLLEEEPDRSRRVPVPV